MLAPTCNTAHFRNINILQCILDTEADINLLESEHSTALRATVVEVYLEIISILIKHDAEVNLCEKKEHYYKKKHDSVLQAVIKV